MNTLYRFYNSLGQLLYIGITNNPAARFRNHANDKWWWPMVVTITLEYFWGRAALERAERSAIESENPLHNHTYNQSVISNQDRFNSSKPQHDGFCPSCGQNVIYNRAFDLIFHIDGSNNVPCWTQIRSGAVEYVGRTDR